MRVSITCEGGIIQGNKIKNLKKMLLCSTEVPILIPNVPMAQAPTYYCCRSPREQANSA